MAAQKDAIQVYVPCLRFDSRRNPQMHSAPRFGSFQQRRPEASKSYISGSISGNQQSLRKWRQAKKSYESSTIVLSVSVIECRPTTAQ